MKRPIVNRDGLAQASAGCLDRRLKPWLPFLAMLARFGFAFFLVLAGCGASEEQLRTRAAFDLDCAESSLRIVEIDDQTRGVRGCGQRATYVERCKPGPTSDCTWVLNSQVDLTKK